MKEGVFQDPKVMLGMAAGFQGPLLEDSMGSNLKISLLERGSTVQYSSWYRLLSAASGTIYSIGALVPLLSFRTWSCDLMTAVQGSMHLVWKVLFT